MDAVDYTKAVLTTEELNKKLKTLLNSDDMVQLVRIYDDWATTFEQDKEKSTWKSYEVLAHEINKFVTDKNVRILDIGAGTGLHAIELQRLGFTNIDAIDPSVAMLQVARERGLYKRYIADYVDKRRLDIGEDTYDVITGAGVFIPSHMTADALNEINRITKPGGFVFIWTRETYYGEEYDYYGERLDAGIKELVNKGVWALESRELVPFFERVFLNVIRKQ